MSGNRTHTAAGVVVRQHHGGGVVVQGPQHHLARVHRGLTERAAKQLLHGNQVVLAVQKQHGKHLVLAVCQVQLQIVFHGLGAVKQRALLQLLGGGAAGQLHHGQNFGLLGRPQAFDAGQVAHAGVEQPRQPALLRQNRVRQLQHAAAGQAGAQQNGQQLRIGQGTCAPGQEFFARQGIGG